MMLMLMLMPMLMLMILADDCGCRALLQHAGGRRLQRLLSCSASIAQQTCMLRRNCKRRSSHGEGRIEKQASKGGTE
jgi:hypothetical protein